MRLEAAVLCKDIREAQRLIERLERRYLYGAQRAVLHQVRGQTGT
jgi:hypothetical protein